jgi:hypothetical protein
VTVALPATRARCLRLVILLSHGRRDVA